MSTTKVAGGGVSTDDLIDGKRVESKRKFPDCSPINNRHIADVSAGARKSRGGASRLPNMGDAQARRSSYDFEPLRQGNTRAHEEIAVVGTEDNGSMLVGDIARVVPHVALNIQFSDF